MHSFCFDIRAEVLRKKTVNKLGVTQLAMKRSMLGVVVRDKIQNTEISRRIDVADEVRRFKRLKWNGAEHEARSTQRSRTTKF